MSVFLYKWDKAKRDYVRSGYVTRDPDEVVYRTSGFRMQSRCLGHCGWMGSNIGYHK